MPAASSWTRARRRWDRSVPGADPGLGDESFGVDYAGNVAGFPVNRYSAVVRIGDTLYGSGLAALFTEPDVAAVMHTLNAILGL